MGGERLGRAATVAGVLWTLALPVLAQALDYDAFSDRDGNITTEQHGRGLIALLRHGGQLEVVYADAVKGNARAGRVFRTLESDYFPDYGRELAELVSRPPCLAPVLRELSGWCVPDWTFLDFLSKDKPGGAGLRKAFFDGYAERARRRGLENQLVLSAMNAILGTSVAATAMREAGAAASAARPPAALEPKTPGVTRSLPRSPPIPGEAAQGLPALRQQYVDAVARLAEKVSGMRQAGMSSEQIARALHAERRALGAQFKDLTPAGKLAAIHARNLTLYGDKLGPGIEWLRAHGKSWEDIIQSATRAGGRDLGF